MGKSPHKLLIIGTTGLDNDVLELTGISSAFNKSLVVPYLTSGTDILYILQESNMYHFTEDELTALEPRLKGKR